MKSKPLEIYAMVGLHAGSDNTLHTQGFMAAISLASRVYGSGTLKFVKPEQSKLKVYENLILKKIHQLSLASVIVHNRGPNYTNERFEGELLGGLNTFGLDYRTELGLTVRDLRLSINELSARLFWLGICLKYMDNYFIHISPEHRLRELFDNSIKPYYMNWINDVSSDLEGLRDSL